MKPFDQNDLDFKVLTEHPLSDTNWIRKGILQHHTECLNDYNHKEPEPVTIIVKDKEGNRIAGTYGYAYLNVFTVEGMYIEKDYRKKGIGKKLSQMLQDEAEKRGCHTATLETYSFAQTKNFYNKIGVLFSKKISNSPQGHNKYILINKLEKDKGFLWKILVFFQALHSKINK